MNAIRRRLNELFFHQPNAVVRAGGARLTVGLTCAVLVLFGIDATFYDLAAPKLYDGLLPISGTHHFLFLKSATVLAAVAAGLGLGGTVVTGSFTILYALLSYQVAHFGPVWSYNTHLLFFAIALTFYHAASRRASRVGTEEAASFFLAFLQISVALVYLQAGLAKLIHGGIVWFISGATIRTAISIDGTAFGRSLLGIDPLFPAAGAFTAIVEFGFIAGIIVPSLRIPATLLALLFHALTTATLRISFWHLGVFLPMLFLWRATKSTRIPEAVQEALP